MARFIRSADGYHPISAHKRSAAQLRNKVASSKPHLRQIRPAFMADLITQPTFTKLKIDLLQIIYLMMQQCVFRERPI